MIRRLAPLACAVLGLFGLQCVCDGFVAWAQWPISGSIVGLLVLWLALVCWGRVPESLSAIADPLQWHLMLWIIPSVAAIGEQAGVIAQHGLALVVVIVIATLLTVLVSARALSMASTRTRQ